ncbi:MAG: glycerophosphodiester phosphodiesterase [Planctomycetota bacterium]
MSNPASRDSLLGSIAVYGSGCWQSMIITDLAYKLLATVVLTPLLTILLQVLLVVRGNQVLSDLDIVLFFAAPLGWLCAIVIGAVWLGILALEQASLLAILAAHSQGKRLGAMGALGYAVNHSVSVVRVAGRLTAISLLVAAPFLLAAGSIYFFAISEYDINYYLDERPTVFRIAVGLGAILGTGLLVILLGLYSGWFLALPLVLFDRVANSVALPESRKMIAGKRLLVLRWMVTWLVVGIIANAMATLLLGMLGRWLIPSTLGSLALLAGRVGMMLLAFAAVSLILNLIGSLGFALIMFHAYEKLHPDAEKSLASVPLLSNRHQLPKLTLNRYRTIGICLIGLLAAAWIGATAISRLQWKDDVKIMAHRGASKAAPENSLSAVRLAIEAGSDWVEIDVQETADGEVVVIHDSDLMKLARNKTKVWDAQLSELRSIDIGSSFGHTFKNERVATLSEVLQLCQGKIKVLIELKYYGHDQQLEQRVADIVEKHRMSDEIMVMSLKPDGVRKIKRLRPNWKCGLLLSVSVGNIQKIEADFLAINARFATRKLINKLHDAKKEIYVWTVDDPISMSSLINRGVDGVITNLPGVARDVLMQRNNMSSTDRLLTEIAALLGKPPTYEEQ